MQPRTEAKIAGQHYRIIELTSRIDSASPHGLVCLLYEELLRALDLASAAAANSRPVNGSRHLAKAMSIIIALEASLDMEKGGDLALNLARIYRACSQSLRKAAGGNDVKPIFEVRDAISKIAYAWQSLAASAPG